MRAQPALPGLGARSAPAGGPDSAIEVGGVTFRRGDDGEYLYYDTRANGCYWYVFRPHLTESMRRRGVGTYWAAHVDRRGAARVLNSAHVGLDGVETRDPLYGDADPPDADPPLRLLAALAALIAGGQDPFAVPRTKAEEIRGQASS